MANKLALPDFTVDYRPTAITINSFDKLKAAVEAYAQKYQGMTVTSSTEKEAKASRAELRKLKTALDEKRKEIKKKYAEPYQVFAAQISDLEAALDDSIDPIDSGLKELENHQRQIRLGHVQALIAEMAPNYHVEPADIEVDPKWLNKTMSKKKVTEGIADVMGYLEKKQEELKTDINTVTKYAQAYKIDPAGWVDQVKQGQDVNYLLKQIDFQVKQKQERQRKLEMQAAMDKIRQKQQGNTVIDTETGEVVSHTVMLKITATIPQMKLLKSFMDSNSIRYAREGA